jgi:hypothetical protein
MSTMNTGNVDLQSVLNVRRRTLASAGVGVLPHHQYLNTDTIYLKREDYSNSILSIDSRILVFGDLQLLCSIFERYTSTMSIYEDSNVDTNCSSTSTSKTGNFFSATAEENEDDNKNKNKNNNDDGDDDDDDGPPIVSTLRRTSVSTTKPTVSQTRTTNACPPGLPVNPFRRKTMSSIGRSQTMGATVNDYSMVNLEGKRYGCIELPSMSIIEILEILLRTGLELADVLSDYDAQHVTDTDRPHSGRVDLPVIKWETSHGKERQTLSNDKMLMSLSSFRINSHDVITVCFQCKD